MNSYEYKKYMRDGTVRIITAVVRSRVKGNAKQKRVEGKEAARV